MDPAEKANPESVPADRRVDRRQVERLDAGRIPAGVSALRPRAGSSSAACSA